MLEASLLDDLRKGVFPESERSIVIGIVEALRKAKGGAGEATKKARNRRPHQHQKGEG